MANPASRGQQRDKPFRDALRMEAAAAEQEEECLAPKGSLRWNARQLLERGDPVAIRELADRLDGKVPQAIVGDDEHGPVQHVIAWKSSNTSSTTLPDGNSSASTNETSGLPASLPIAEPEKP